MGQKAGLLILSAWLALMSAQVSALGLGAISLKSNLNQPLSAEIELLEVRGLTESEVLVGLASQDDFDRVGVDRNYFLTDLSFDIDLEGKNGPVVKINSTKVVREPYLNFVILVRWPSGKLLREYTVLMDLPIYSDDAPAPVNSAQSSSRSSQQGSAPSSRQNSRSEYNTQANATNNVSSGGSGPSYTGSTYEVAPEDTLWEIALEVRPDNSVSVHQTMMAIQVANPDAFISNNINLLKKGQILRIPERTSMTSVNQRQAVVEVKDQIQRWSGNDDATAAPLASSSSYSAPNQTANSTEGRVKLSAPKENFGSEQGSGSGSSENTSSEALARELSSTLEELDKSSRENNELRSTVQSLEEQIKTMERMIEVGNEDLRAMELSTKAREEGLALARKAEAEGLALARKAEEEALAAAAEAERLANEAQSRQNNAAAESGSANAPAAAPTATPKPVATATPVPEKVKKPAVVSSPVVESKGIVDLILDNILYVGLGLILLLAVGGFLIQRKMSNADFDDDDDDEFLDLDSEDFPDDEESFDELKSDDEFSLDTGVSELHVEDEALIESQMDEEIVEEAAEEAEPETEDVVAEADIYIAYGKYDQAEEMLVKAIDRDPSFHEARLKLLESYAAEQDIGRFDPHFAKLVAVGSSDLTDRAERLRTTIHDAPDFNPHEFDTSEFEELVDASFEPGLSPVADDVSEPDDFDLDLDFNDSAADIESDGDSTLDASLELDDVAFDLDGLDVDDSDAPNEETEESDFDLDLDLDENFDLDDLSLSDVEEPMIDSAPADDLELDLSSLDSSLDDDLSLDSDLSLGDDLSLDSDLSLGDDLSLDSDLSLDGDLSLDDDLPEVEESRLDTENIDPPANLDDDLSLDDLDLSALDDELEAMSKDLDGGLDNDSLLEGGLDDTASLGGDLGELDLGELDLGELDNALDLEDDEELSVANLPETVELDELDELDDLDGGFDELDATVKEDELSSAPTETFARLDTSVDFTLPDIDPDSVEDDDLDFLSDSDETATKLDLARAYIDMGDAEGARDIIDEIVKEGSEQHKADAESLLARLDT